MNNAWAVKLISIISFSAAFTSCVDSNVCGDNMLKSNGMCVFPKDTAAKDLLTATLQIPKDFEGKPVLLTVNYFDNLNMEGVPSGFGDTISHPEIEPGGVFELISSQAQLEGEFYLTITLYCEGGGNGRGPIAGVDWVSSRIISVILGPGTRIVDVGEVDLVLLE